MRVMSNPQRVSPNPKIVSQGIMRLTRCFVHALYVVDIKENVKCTPDRTRTCDPRIRNPMLYPLSYGRMKDV